MHPVNDPDACLDAVFFSPHKFLGGPGTPGMLIFHKKMYKNLVPDQPGGGTVTFTNPWGEHFYFDDIETREDGGTPGFLQTIRAALAIKLKEEMGVENIIEREHELLSLIFEKLDGIPNLRILADNTRNRLGVISFYIENAHFNLIVALLNDRFGVQTRGGCSCAGTYGHYLLQLDHNTSDVIAKNIKSGNYLSRPGWVRMSIHPTMTNAEAAFICEALAQVAEHWQDWGKDYTYDAPSNEYKHNHFMGNADDVVYDWFNRSLAQ
jgi:selenocysteine lyase/cysteine desulfurase